jgi:Rrf2 family protein
MFITREADYAVRCVLFLSREAGRIISANEIAESMTIPKSFLAKILQRLTRGAIVRSTQGIAGGFELAKKSSKVSILEVIEAIQGPTAVNICAVDERNCDLSNTCSVHPVWIELRKVIERRLQKENFAGLIRRGRKRRRISPGLRTKPRAHS